ncbi:hypothetical protein A9R05_43540 (plasmid) [Burkholderia sp. KK1]|uniref:hypothetical protein n=1 Tax=Burkholderia TaxID=32008 RepID=UPI000979AE80|nr:MULTISPECIES: hypothetical protein [Burkholderia]AQH05879.1 hypothetical protein A9R05_43540 [Burkholderia sp. KK1]
MATIRDETREIEVINGYLESMGQAAISGPHERAQVLGWILEQLKAAEQYGHSTYDGYEVAENLRDMRQRTVHVVQQ